MQAKYRPDRPPLDVERLSQVTPLTAQNVHDARRTWAAPALARLQDVFESNSALIAQELGDADPRGRGSVNDPVRERTATTDGKVTTPIGLPFRLLTAGEVSRTRGISQETHVYSKVEKKIGKPSKMPQDGVQLYDTGKGPKVGHKTISVGLRSDLTNSTVVLALRRQTTTNEAAEACAALVDVQRRLDHGLVAAVMGRRRLWRSHPTVGA